MRTLTTLVVFVGVLLLLTDGTVPPAKGWNNFRLEQDKRLGATVDYVHKVKTQCSCRAVCFSLPGCLQATVVEVSGQLQCEVSNTAKTYLNLVDSPGSITFYWFHPYQRRGELYYELKMATPLPYRDGEAICHAEGGHLAVLDTVAKKNEALGFLTENGNPPFIWIGLWIQDPDIIQNNNVHWRFKEGQTIPSGFFHTTASNRRCYAMEANGDYSNVKECADSLPYLCQRDY